MCKSRIKSIVSILFVCLLISLFFVFSVLFVFINSNVFPILNGLILLSFLFLFKGRYRVYAFIFFSSFTKCMIMLNTRVGSFLTWNMVIYILVVMIERIVKREGFKNKETHLLTTYACFICFAFITDLINLQNVSLLKFVSALSYLSLPLIIFLDNYAEKKVSKMLLSFSLSIILMNTFAFFFAYILKQYRTAFFGTYLPDHINQIKYYVDNYRFSGLTGDPNHNALYILIAVSINLIYIKSIKKHVFLFIFLSVLMTIFGFIGQSKTFFLALSIMFFIIMFEKAKKKENRIFVLFIAVCTIIVVPLLSVSIPVLTQVLLRFVDIDSRAGFLESISTQRMHIWTNYLSYYSSNPLKAILGHGVWPSYKLFDWDYHNSFIQLLWEYGSVGSFFFVLYMGRFIVPKSKVKTLFCYMPTIILFVFGLSLHIVYDEFIYSGLFIYNYLLTNINDEKRFTTVFYDAHGGKYYELEI